MTLLLKQKTKLLQIKSNDFSRKHLGCIVNKIKIKFISSSLLMCLFFCSLFFSQNVIAQSYGDTVVFGDSDEYSFDYTLVCSGDGTTALLTVDFTAPPPGNVPQVHLGGGNFFGMQGPNPYTYTFTGLTDCDFYFQFWIAYAGGLYSSEFYDPTSLPLPVELINFSVSKDGARAATLEWSTASEINSDYFGVERSVDGINWENIDQVRAEGYSFAELSYTYVDSGLALGSRANEVFYYRLKLTDLDGSYEYSKIRSIEFTNNDKKIAIYPNPTLKYINVDLKDLDRRGEGLVQLALYDDSGREVMIKEVNDSQTELIDMTNLPAATYYFIIKQGIETIYYTSITKVD